MPQEKFIKKAKFPPQSSSESDMNNYSNDQITPDSEDSISESIPDLNQQ